MKKQGSYSTLFKPRILYGLLSLSIKGYFVEKGWINSYLTKQALDTSGNPIPWLTYSFLDFISGRLKSNFKLFEFGAGNSTLYFSEFVASVKSVEHDEDWFNKIRPLLPNNVNMEYVNLGENYSSTIFNEDESYDIILVDGRQRVDCCKKAVQKLTSQGVIILDDSERAKYKEAFDFFKDNGFRHIPFTGIAIGAIHHKSTSIFYRDNNCLEI
ncbi:class I SAM-dependent methyltransferase [Sphingobacterium alkalisoli]|uniref:Class I SAM-dependent methyltransferase n=1 Tax=Sphingobacterium alkalisoli TaxID=1874115 RepID=A0A4U0HBR5_9SPHI|nr:class I SAM-dependent methyltransferase [Sphingobacterium alkalisoli]TJY68042.1 class I SAM-dependent methyltransferase [Sphingobacterium alkalisoli]GGH09462.1 hypothetical protein GCM10011418_07460 [Sphingobacterium alkalisoli]